MGKSSLFYAVHAAGALYPHSRGVAEVGERMTFQIGERIRRFGTLS